MNKKLAILYLCIFVVMTGYGLILPVLPFFVERLALEEGLTQSNVFIHIGLLTGVFAFMQFLSAPFWGNLSDRVGRKPILLFGLFGFSISMIIFGLGTNILILYSARIFGGLLSGATFPIAAAYVSDVTTDDGRGSGMSWLGGASGLGVVVGPIIGSFFSKLNLEINFNFGDFAFNQFSFPFIFSAILSLMILSIAIIWLPESRYFHFNRDSSSFKQKFNILINPLLIPKRLRSFLFIAFVYQFALATFESNFAMHAKEILGFGPFQMGIIFSVCGLTMAIVQAILTGKLITFYGERILILTGNVLMVIGLILLMPEQKLLFIVGSVIILAFGVALIIPSLTTLVSKQFYMNVGVSLGLLNSANSLGQASGAGLSGYLFTYQIHLPYVIALLLLFTSVVYLGYLGIQKGDRFITINSLKNKEFDLDKD